jgi:hypothetical protein
MMTAAQYGTALREIEALLQERTGYDEEEIATLSLCVIETVLSTPQAREKADASPGRLLAPD